MPKWYQRREDRWLEGAHGRRWWRLVGVGVVLLVIVLGHRQWLPILARALVLEQPPGLASAILVLGGGDGSREDRGLELYLQGLAPVIITSGEKPQLPGQERTYAELSADYLTVRGVARDAILLMPQTTSTRDEAMASLSLAHERGFSSLLVITDSPHTRRAWLTFRRIFHGSGIRVAIVAAHPSWFNPKTWWLEERSLLTVFTEYEKLAFYLTRGYL